MKELKALRDAGNKIPALDRQPELDPGIDWLWDAYVELDRSRGYQMGQAQPVAVSEIMAYSNLVGLDREDASLLLTTVRTLEKTHFERIAARSTSGRTRSRNRRKARKARR